MFRRALQDGRGAQRRSSAQQTDDEALFRLVFRLLAAKVFKDRRVLEKGAGDGLGADGVD